MVSLIWFSAHCQLHCHDHFSSSYHSFDRGHYSQSQYSESGKIEAAGFDGSMFGVK
jgi:hypothetical protein